MATCFGFICVVQCHAEMLVVLWQRCSSLSMVCDQNWGTHFLSKAAWWVWIRYWGISQHKVFVCVSAVLSWFCFMQCKHKAAWISGTVVLRWRDVAHGCVTDFTRNNTGSFLKKCISILCTGTFLRQVPPCYCIVLGKGWEEVYFCLNNLLVVRTIKLWKAKYCCFFQSEYTFIMSLQVL